MLSWEKISKLKSLLPLIGILLFIYIIHDVGIENLYSALESMNIFLLIASFFIFVPRIFISTYKWKMVAEMQGISVKFFPLIGINLVGLFYGTVTPLWLGDWIRIFYLKEESGAALGKCASNVIIDQLIEFFSLFILSIFGSLLLLNRFPLLFAIIAGFFIFLLGVAIFFMEKNRSRKIFSLAYRYLIPSRLKEYLAKEFDYFYESIPSLKKLLKPLVVEIFSYTLFFTQIYMVAISLSLSIPYIHFILIYPISSLIGMIPITISGFGTREGALISILSIYGVAKEKAVALSLTGYFITIFIPAMIGGIISIFYARRIATKNKIMDNITSDNGPVG